MATGLRLLQMDPPFFDNFFFMVQQLLRISADHTVKESVLLVWGVEEGAIKTENFNCDFCHCFHHRGNKEASADFLSHLHGQNSRFDSLLVLLSDQRRINNNSSLNGLVCIGTHTRGLHAHTQGNAHTPPRGTSRPREDYTPTRRGSTHTHTPQGNFTPTRGLHAEEPSPPHKSCAH